jgi:hypothetical protein
VSEQVAQVEPAHAESHVPQVELLAFVQLSPDEQWLTAVQAVQLEAPAAEKVPLAHAVQLDAPAAE